MHTADGTHFGARRRSLSALLTLEAQSHLLCEGDEGRFNEENANGMKSERRGGEPGRRHFLLLR